MQDFLQNLAMVGVLLLIGIGAFVWYVIRHYDHLAKERRRTETAKRKREDALTEQEHNKALLLSYQAELASNELVMRQFQMQLAAYTQQQGGTFEWTANGFKASSAPVKVVEAAPVQERIAAPVQVQQRETLQLPPVPTFSQAFVNGDIDPNQQEMLVCYEMVRDEDTGEIIDMATRKDKLENNSTIFLGGGSKSGKTTMITHIAGQEAMQGAMLYVIDPHLMHPEKSVMVRLAPLRRALIMEPAMTDEDIFTVLQHARAEADARVNKRETKLSGRPILFIVDECLAVMARAQRTDNKQVQGLYRELAFFMRDLGTQYNKFGMNGIFASQYVTKDAFRLPGGNVDFRDGCQSQTLLRLPANQAQAMRLIPKEDLRGIRTLAPGHGYMGFSDGDIIRMATGNVTVRDMEMVARMRGASPLTSTQFGGFGTTTAILERDTDPVQNAHSPEDRKPVFEQRNHYITGELVNEVSPLVRTGEGIGETHQTSEPYVSLTDAERATIIAAAQAQMAITKKDKVNRTKLIESLHGVDKSWNNKKWDKVAAVLDEKGW